MRRVKLNDMVTFPHYLDLNSFIFDEAPSITPPHNTDALGGEVIDTMGSEHTDDVISSDDEGAQEMKEKSRVNGNYNYSHENGNSEEFDFEGPPPGKVLLFNP